MHNCTYGIIFLILFSYEGFKMKKLTSQQIILNLTALAAGNRTMGNFNAARTLEQAVEKIQELEEENALYFEEAVAMGYQIKREGREVKG